MISLKIYSILGTERNEILYEIEKKKTKNKKLKWS